MSATERRSIVTQINDLTKLADEGVVPAPEMALYVHLLLRWNKLRRPEWFEMPRSELKRVTVIKSEKTITRVRNSLQSMGLIQVVDPGGRKKSLFHINEIKVDEIVNKMRQKSAISNKPYEVKITPQKDSYGVKNTSQRNECGVNNTSKNEIIGYKLPHKGGFMGENLPPKQRNRENNSEPVSVNSSNTMLTPRDMYINIQGPGIITDADFEKIVQRYEAEIGAPSKGAREALRKAAEEFGADAVEAGISMAVRRNVKNSGFVLGIVRSMAHGGMCGKECLS